MYSVRYSYSSIYAINETQRMWSGGEVPTYLCVFSDVQANIYSLRITTNLLVVIIMTSRLRLYYLLACSLEHSSAIWYNGSIYTSSTSHHHQLCQHRNRRGSKSNAKDWWWCAGAMWYWMVWYGWLWYNTIERNTPVQKCALFGTNDAIMLVCHKYPWKVDEKVAC